jgi:xanthosine utilization system XapX-like protein
MNWVDIVSLAVVITITVTYSIRGKDAMGVAIFDMAAAVVAAWAATRFHATIAQGIHLSSPATYAILFVVLLGILLFASSRLFNFMQLQFSPFNTFVSFIAGIIAGWAFAFVLLQVISEAAPEGGSAATAVAGSSVASEIVHFHTIATTTARLDSATLLQDHEPGERAGQPKPSQLR